MSPQEPSTAGLPPVTRWMHRWFRRYSRRYLARHFSAVRIAGAEHLDGHDGRPLVVYSTHAGWWDPLVSYWLAATSWPDRVTYGPIDAAALVRYRFFARLGFFPLEPGTPQGLRTLLRMGRAMASEPSSALWITAQGRFADPRERPLELAAGLSALARDLHGREPGRGARFLPIAIEYPFWEERTPEVLVEVGPALPLEAETDADRERLHARLSGALEDAQDRLARRAIARNPEAFSIALAGRGGVGGIYDLWRRARAVLRGQRFEARHAGRAP